ncbi:hypothetical protein [Rhodoblastus sp.]|uniref:hypothetical protein n=1 Tax=Rhodoblastus sp. TaxID=1962975 RepID=UPI003F9A0028
MISQRTKAALRAAKARGVKLGNPNVRANTEATRIAKQAQADAFARLVAPVIREARWCTT